MSFSFKYRPVKLPSYKTIYRPIVPLTFNGQKEKLDFFGLLDSGSDITIIPMDLADILGLEFIGENKFSGITNLQLNAKQAIASVTFGKGHEKYTFNIQVLIPISTDFNKIIIGRAGFFNEFKIIFDEAKKRIEFKKANESILMKLK